MTGKPVFVNLNIDNQSTIKIIQSGQMSKRTKHIEVRYRFISREYSEGLFDLQFCPSENQVADILTKPLLRVKFERFRNFILTSNQTNI